MLYRICMWCVSIGLKFIFLCFFCMVMYDDEFKTKLKGNKILNQVYNRTTTSTSRLSYSADHTIATEPKAFKVTPTLFI